MLHRIFTLWSSYIASSRSWGTEGEKTRVTTKGVSEHVDPMGPAIVQRPASWVPLIWDSVLTQESSLTGGQQAHQPNETDLGIPNYRSLCHTYYQEILIVYDNALYHFWYIRRTMKFVLRGVFQMEWNIRCVWRVCRNVDFRGIRS